MKTCVATLAALAMSISVAHAQNVTSDMLSPILFGPTSQPQPLPPQQTENIPTLVAQCVQSVRQGKDGVYSEDPYFDAYYDPSLNRFSWIGTEKDFFYFKKCLTAGGTSLSNTPPPPAKEMTATDWGDMLEAICSHPEAKCGK
jgi:hypothetical protein